jgi:hypothetical protein
VAPQEAGQRADRCLHPAGQLGQQDLAGRQRGEARDVVGADRPVAEHAARDRTIRCTGGCIDDGLGRRRLVGPERDRGRDPSSKG